MIKSVRTVRFDKKELARIEEFLKANPFFDFSTLTRLSVQRFIENPQLQVKAISSKSKQKKVMEL
ncbi:MAG: hypothetical protein H7235_04325 [Bdellovibrionaceae bacterium]|nr:hypothetical protein [Pseudobdellovibrionaceae bacterium]